MDQLFDHQEYYDYKNSRALMAGPNGETRRDVLFRPDSADYDPRAFYTSSVDDGGNTKTIRASVPPAMYSELERLVQSGMIPAYGTKEAFVRDAMVHRLKWLAHDLDNDSLIKAVNHQIRQADMQRRIEEMHSCRRYVETTKQGIRDAEDHNDAIAVDEIAMTGWAASQDMRAPYSEELKTICRNAVKFDISDLVSWPSEIVDTMAMEDVKFHARLTQQREEAFAPNMMELLPQADTPENLGLPPKKPTAKIGGKGGSRTAKLFGTDKD